ncbi:P2X purinoceptor 3 [Aquila chrysaetos chrysaetos]|uniref:P2X purinoceptor 3 n=1 Tax=Aquila chrysaetos chrysaetos TaxID=223781 RepID=UPI0011769D63|nr:P2X purinoceptor 3 [Aquila chrysaetos chrysaetos]
MPQVSGREEPLCAPPREDRATRARAGPIERPEDSRLEWMRRPAPPPPPPAIEVGDGRLERPPPPGLTCRAASPGTIERREVSPPAPRAATPIASAPRPAPARLPPCLDPCLLLPALPTPALAAGTPARSRPARIAPRCRYRCPLPPCPHRPSLPVPLPAPALPCPCPPPHPGTRWVTDFFSYETTKSVVVKSWVVGAVNRGVQLLILAYFIGWVFLHEKAYQVRDTVIESSVVTKVKGIGRYAGRVLDTADYVTPHQGTSVFVVVTKQILTENQVQGVCPESEAEYRCTADRDCQGKSPTTGSGVLTGRCVPYNGSLSTCEIQGWCPPEVDTVDVPVMLEAENFTLFIKNSIRFPLFGFEKANLPPPGSWGELGRCRFHPERQPLCPILRLGDVVRLAGQDFPTLAATGGVLGIKIGWVCDLDRAWERCLPRYSFTRLDGLARPPAPAPGYNFRHARYYRWPDGTERRTLTKAFGIRFDVLVYGNAGKFGIVPTLINTVAAFTSIGVGTVLCDIILLNFLKGAEHYKARKFEEVPEAGVPAPPTSPTACPLGALGGCSRDKQSTDSGTFSLGL